MCRFPTGLKTKAYEKNCGVRHYRLHRSYRSANSTRCVNNNSRLHHPLLVPTFMQFDVTADLGSEDVALPEVLHIRLRRDEVSHRHILRRYTEVNRSEVNHRHSLTEVKITEVPEVTAEVKVNIEVETVATADRNIAMGSVLPTESCATRVVERVIFLEPVVLYTLCHIPIMIHISTETVTIICIMITISLIVTRPQSQNIHSSLISFLIPYIYML